MIALGVPNRVKMFFFKKFITTRASLEDKAVGPEAFLSSFDDD